ncbi:hypothetical protein E1508_05220 [Pseudomonas moraviensis]|nr:hypothetical protein E1508_05220 [Pseudomonas moraviensis]
MGASLLAKAMYQSAHVLNVKPLSRAGSLPHLFDVAPENNYPQERGTCGGRRISPCWRLS